MKYIYTFFPALVAIMLTVVAFTCNKTRTATLPIIENSNSLPLLFEETFEGPTPLATAYSTDFGTDYAFTVVNTPVFSGKLAGRFELRNTDPLVNSGKRSEVSLVKPGAEADRWYSFAVYFPAAEFQKDSQQETFCQWHQSADKYLGEDGQSPATALRIKHDRFYLDTGFNPARVSEGVLKSSRRKIDLGAVTKDTWHAFVIHMVHAYDERGLIEIWHNGQKVLYHQGGNMYNNSAMPKCKLGIYKASFKSGASEVTRRVLYFDNIRVGNDKATFALMNPARDSTGVH